MNKLLLLVLALPAIFSCDNPDTTQEKPSSLLIYCGITMAHPIKDIAEIVEAEKNVKILINQGGSEDLYISLKNSHKGDLYLPGSASYREKHLSEGLLGDAYHVGYNQASFIVKKGNPKNITADITQLLRDDLGIIIGNSETGSIGRETKRILDKKDIYQQVIEKATFVTTDSRNLNKALRNGDADVILNWKATAFFSENSPFMEIIKLDEKVATPKELLLNKLTFSNNPEISQYFIDLATSKKGQDIFRSYGFLSKVIE